MLNAAECCQVVAREKFSGKIFPGGKSVCVGGNGGEIMCHDQEDPAYSQNRF
ncbi:MAG: hypothetical protein RR387_00855 [Clostridiales bacterium]